MVNAILGKKLGMTQIFAADGAVVPVTVLKAGPCIVIQRKTREKDGYEAAQLSLIELPGPKRTTQGMEGHFKKAGANPARFLRAAARRTGRCFTARRAQSEPPPSLRACCPECEPPGIWAWTA